MKRILPRILGWSALGLVVLLLVALVLARALFNQYLHSAAFRHTLSQGAARALHASDADFSPLDFDGSMVYGENFHATRDDGGGFSSIDADQLRANFDWHGLLHHAVQIDELSIQRLNVEPPAASGVTENTEGLSAPPPSTFPLGGRTWTVDLRKAMINEANWHWSPQGGIAGTALTLTPDGKNWVISAQGGTVSQTGWPDLHLESAAMRWQPPTLYINSANLTNGDSHMEVTGSIQTRDSLDLLVDFQNLNVQPVLTPDWREKLSGRLSGHAEIKAPLGQGDAAGALTVTGSAAMTNGVLTALPILDQIGLFTQTERFRRLDLTRASAEFTRTPTRLEMRNMVVEAAGLIRCEGSYTLENGQIDGTFQVGLTPSTLQWIPGSQEQVFTIARDGYRWTTMRLTGPAAHPVDDLTPRLVAATGNKLIDGVKGVEGTVKKGLQEGLDLLMH
ncbi:MAG TPA: hypothetical protein VHY22_14610 [Chthoniobacteraceae bacterium]|jgi:hypothetical protein|nr:hypothetical protein [Chthoniobacteraceae bacterium]